MGIVVYWTILNMLWRLFLTLATVFLLQQDDNTRTYIVWTDQEYLAQVGIETMA